jgi:YidC/Oxa1 family membrane protein insertase
MAKMKAVQPQMAMIKERYADDKMKQQQAMMELYKKEQINPLAGCLPIAIQIPVFFSLYKVLFITIEMRHAPGSTICRRKTRPTFSPSAA